MDYKHSCVVDAESCYKDIVLVLFEPGPSRIMLDLGDFGSTEIKYDAFEAEKDLLTTSDIRCLEGVSTPIAVGTMEDGRVVYLAHDLSGSKGAMVIVDPTTKASIRFVGALTEENDVSTITDDKTGGAIAFKLTMCEGELQENIQHYTLAVGERLIDTKQPPMCPYSGAPGLVRPRWDDETADWGEGATAEEIASWEAEHPAPEPPGPTPQEDADALLVDHEYRLTLLELGVN